jgi:hypothetical protein
MKTLSPALAILMLSASLAMAQDTSNFSARNPTTSSKASGGHDITGFSYQGAPALNPESTKNFPNPNVVLKPKLGGVFVDGGKYGPILISPAAPATYGMGEKYLAAPSTRWDVERQSGPAAHRDAGGIKVFTFEF